MKVQTGRQFGLGNRTYTLTEDFEFFGRHLPAGLTVDGSSVPKVPILTCSTILYWCGLFSGQVLGALVVAMMLVGICESAGWFMKPAAVHDYRFQNASNVWGWIPANVEYMWLMILKIHEYIKINPNGDNIIRVVFHCVMGILIVCVHVIFLMLCGWIVWLNYYRKNKNI
jgi:hypothetical protein